MLRLEAGSMIQNRKDSRRRKNLSKGRKLFTIGMGVGGEEEEGSKMRVEITFYCGLCLKGKPWSWRLPLGM